MNKYQTLAALLFFLIILIGACSSPTFVPMLSHQPSETPLTTWLFTHPQHIYSLRFPVGWRQEVVVRGPGISEVSFTSPKYQISSGYPILESGAEFLVLSKPLAVGIADAEQYFTTNPLINQLARNRTTLKVAGYPAIQYDFSYEGVEALMTIFIAHGKLFQVRYRYINSAARSEFMGEYKVLLTSLIAYNIQ
jgi:hypothetical protein